MRAVSGLVVGCVAGLAFGLSAPGAEARAGGGRGGIAHGSPGRPAGPARAHGRSHPGDFYADAGRADHATHGGFGGGRGRYGYGSGFGGNGFGSYGFGSYGYGGYGSGYGFSGYGFEGPGASLAYPAAHGPSPVVTPGPGEGSIPVGVGIRAPAVLPPAVYVLGGGRHRARGGDRSGSESRVGGPVFADSRDAAGDSGVAGRTRLIRLTSDRR